MPLCIHLNRVWFTSFIRCISSLIGKTNSLLNLFLPYCSFIILMYFDQFFKFEFSFTWHSRFTGQQAMIYPDDFWAYHYLDYKWLCRDGNVPSSSMLKSWWPSVGWNPWRLHIFHAFEWFTMDKVFSYLKTMKKYHL